MNPTLIQFNPFCPEFHLNPYPTYAHLRQTDPIHWSFLQAWMITRFAEVETLLKDPRLQVDDLPSRLQQKSQYLKQGNFDALVQTIEQWLFFLAPPHHTRLRGLVSKAFAIATIEAMRPQIQHHVDQLLATVQPTGQMDVVQDLAAPLPALLLTQILGLPIADFAKLMHWSYDLFFVFDQPMSLEGYQQQNQIAQEARGYFSEVISQQKMQPGGLIDRLVNADQSEPHMSLEEVLGFCLMLLVVGQETTKSLIGNAIYTLLNQPQALTELKQQPNLIQPAIEELLRYETPVQMIARLATEPIEIADKTIRTGEKVILLLGAANRDPAQFAHPDQLDFHRRHFNLPFGGGLHYCLGAALARVQAQIAVQGFIQRIQHPQIMDHSTIAWRESITLRGLKKLLIQFEA